MNFSEQTIPGGWRSLLGQPPHTNSPQQVARDAGGALGALNLCCVAILTKLSQNSKPLYIVHKQGALCTLYTGIQ